MRKQSITIVICFVIAALFGIAVSLIVPSYNSAENNGKPIPFNDGWMIENENGDFVPFDGFGTTIESNEITLMHEHDESLNSIDALGFYNYYSVVEVYTGDDIIYSYGSKEDVGKGAAIGNYYSMIEVHKHEASKSPIKIVFYSDIPQTIYGFKAGRGASLEMEMMMGYILTLILPVMTLLFILISYVINRESTFKNVITRRHKWILVFAGFLSVWVLADSQLLMDLGFKAGNVCMLSFEIYMLLPIPFMMLMYHSCKRMKKIDLSVSLIALVNFVVLNLLNFLQIRSFVITTLPTQIIVGLSLIIGLIQIIWDYTRKKNRDTELLLIGYLVFLATTTVQFLKFYVNPAESNTNYMIIGFLVLFLLQMGCVLFELYDKTRLIKKRLETQTQFLKQTFKTIVPDDLDNLLYGKTNNVAISGKVKHLTVIESDIRGFTQLIRDMSAEDAIDMLNHYFESMTTIIRRHNGVVLEFVGDAVIAFFDEEHNGKNHANNAIFTAVEMQRAMKDIQEWNRQRKYPVFEMGIGINTGDVYVGYIGSEHRMEYDAIGSTMNLVSRIEGYSTGGQILISKSCKDAITKNIDVLNSFVIKPKGYSDGVEVFLIGGIGEPYNLKCFDIDEVPHTLEEPVPITFSVLEGKHCGEEKYPAVITEESKTSATLESDHVLELFDNLLIQRFDGQISGKVISKSEKGYLVRFTSAF